MNVLIRNIEKYKQTPRPNLEGIILACHKEINELKKGVKTAFTPDDFKNLTQTIYITRQDNDNLCVEFGD